MTQQVTQQATQQRTRTHTKKQSHGTEDEAILKGIMETEAKNMKLQCDLPISPHQALLDWMPKESRILGFTSGCPLGLTRGDPLGLTIVDALGFTIFDPEKAEGEGFKVAAWNHLFRCLQVHVEHFQYKVVPPRSKWIEIRGETVEVFDGRDWDYESWELRNKAREELLFLLHGMENGWQAIHTVWGQAREHDKRIKHPLAPIVRAWLQEQSAKTITHKVDQTHTAAIIKEGIAGSIRDFEVVDGMGELMLRDVGAAPASTEQLLFDAIIEDTALPARLPLQYLQTTNARISRANGTVPLTARVFFEAIMRLEPKETHGRIKIPLGVLLNSLNPPKTDKPGLRPYVRHRVLPRLVEALHGLTLLRIPYLQDTNNPRSISHWAPVLARSTPDLYSDDDSLVVLDVDLPPDARRGMLVEKHPLRYFGKFSAPGFSAYLVACYLFDKHGTQRGRFTDATIPGPVVDSEGFLLKNAIINREGKAIKGERIYHRGKALREGQEYHKAAVPHMPRVRNPNADVYPVLSFEDLTRACYPNGWPQGKYATYERNARRAWQELEHSGFLKIEKHPNGWRILPSENHGALYRSLVRSR